MSNFWGAVHIEIALDDRSNKKLRNPDNMLKYVKERITDKETYYIILDEVQLLDEFEDALNRFLHIRIADVYVTGSNSKFLSSGLITEFRGRGDEIHIYPLSFTEFASVYKGTFAEAWDDYFITEVCRLFYHELQLMIKRNTFLLCLTRCICRILMNATMSKTETSLL